METSSRGRTIVYRVTRRDQGVRLDLFLKERIPRMSREGIKEAIRRRVAVAGRPKARPSTSLRAGDEVIVTYPAGEEAAGAGAAEGAEAPRGESARPLPDVLHEDASLLVVDKPAGMLVHATSASRSLSLLGTLRLSGHEGLRLVHRLDRETSGVIVLARTAGAARILSRAFAHGGVEKRYLAAVFGVVKRDEGAIDLPLGRAAGSAVHVKQGVDGERGRPARTGYRVLERLDDFTLLELHPLTGRRHQIRVHLRAMGHPVVGDKLYAARESHHIRFLERGFDERMRRDLLADRQLLHAASISFPHPDDGHEVTFEAPLPEDIECFLAEHRRASG